MKQLMKSVILRLFNKKYDGKKSTKYNHHWRRLLFILLTQGSINFEIYFFKKNNGIIFFNVINVFLHI